MRARSSLSTIAKPTRASAAAAVMTQTSAEPARAMPAAAHASHAADRPPGRSITRSSARSTHAIQDADAK